MKVNSLKVGAIVLHPDHGKVQFKGLVTKHLFTREPKTPHEYMFWQEPFVDQYDLIETDGDMEVSPMKE